MATYSFFQPTVPTIAFFASGNANAGVYFSSSISGNVNGFYFYKDASDTGTHVGYLWRVSDQANLVSITFSGETPTGWQYQALSSPYSIASNTNYIVGIDHVSGLNLVNGQFGAPVVSGPLTAPTSPNGVYTLSLATYPSTNSVGSNYYADLSFTPTVSASFSRRRRR